MIDIIISATKNTRLQDIKNTLSSLINEDIHVILVTSGAVADEVAKEEIRKTFPEKLNITYIKNGNDLNSHVNNFLLAFQRIAGNEIITFLKAGDLFSGIYLCPIIEKEFEENPKLLTLHGKVDSMNNLNLYTNKYLNVQGWFFRRGFLDYYTFLNRFTTEIEFALNFSYITDLQPQFHKELNRSTVYINTVLSDIGSSLYNYFNKILPEQQYFNTELGVKYLYNLVCDCYISYIQAINLEIPKDDIDSLIIDIDSFYKYFNALELTNLELLLKIYNNKMKEIYLSEDNSFLIKIPDVTLIDFLNNFVEKE